MTVKQINTSDTSFMALVYPTDYLLFMVKIYFFSNRPSSLSLERHSTLQISYYPETILSVSQTPLHGRPLSPSALDRPSRCPWSSRASQNPLLFLCPIGTLQHQTLSAQLLKTPALAFIDRCHMS
jgi:hypothetical protein